MFVAKERNKQDRLQRKEKTETVHFTRVQLHDKGIGSFGAHVAEAIPILLLDPVDGGKEAEKRCDDVLRGFRRVAVEMEDQNGMTKREKDYGKKEFRKGTGKGKTERILLKGVLMVVNQLNNIREVDQRCIRRHNRFIRISCRDSVSLLNAPPLAVCLLRIV